MVTKADAAGAANASLRIAHTSQGEAATADAELAAPATRPTALASDTVDTTAARRTAAELTPATSGAVAPSAPGAAPTKPAGDQGMGAVMGTLGKLMDKAADLGSNLWVQGGLGIGSTLGWLGNFGASIAGIAAGVGLVVSFCQFMKSLMQEGGKPDWMALAQTCFYALAVFVPHMRAAGAFGGLVGMVNSAMSNGKDVVAPGTPRTGVAQTA